MYTPLKLTGLSNIEFVFEGNMTLPANVTAVEAIVNNTDVYPGHWITVANSTGVTLTASKDPHAGFFMAHGDFGWPAGAADGNNDARPHFFSDVTSLRLRDLKILRSVAWVFSLGGSDVYMTNTVLDAFNTGRFPHLLYLGSCH